MSRSLTGCRCSSSSSPSSGLGRDISEGHWRAGDLWGWLYDKEWSIKVWKMSKRQPWFYVPGCLDSVTAAQLHDLMQLKQENSYLTTIARQISPYILSIAKVKERLEPRSCIPAEYSVPSPKKISICQICHIWQFAQTYEIHPLLLTTNTQGGIFLDTNTVLEFGGGREFHPMAACHNWKVQHTQN